MARCQAAAERLKAREAEEAVRAIESGASGPQTARTVAARELAARPAAGPAPARHVETPDLIRRLASPGGSAVVDQVVARLCAKVDPDFEPLYRKCCRRVLAGELPVGDVIGGFRWAMNAPGRGVKKGPSFAAYLKERAERTAEKTHVQRRRE